MDYNGVLWILQKSVNGLGKTSMDVYGMFQGRRPDHEAGKLKRSSIIAFFSSNVLKFSTNLYIDEENALTN